MHSLNDLLSVEDKGRLEQFRCHETGLPIWPLVRVAFFREIISEFFYDTPIASVSSFGPGLGAKVSTLLRSELWNYRAQRRLTPASLMLTSDTVADQSRETQRFNRLSDPLAACFPGKSITLLDQYGWDWPFPRSETRVVFHSPFQARITVAGYLKMNMPRVRLLARDLSQSAYVAASNVLGWQASPARQDAFQRFVARKVGALPCALAYYRTMMDQVRPVCLLACGVSYGPLMPLVTAAREAGACIAEYQHGAISRGHDAYNFGERIRQSAEYRKTLPDYFLSYGRWWEQQVNLPVQMVTIGNPARTMVNLHPVARSQDKALVLCDGIDLEKYLCFGRDLAVRAEKYKLKVVIRPHPVERKLLASMSPDNWIGCQIDNSTTIFDAIAGAELVISELSTGLFDAIGLCQRIVAWRTQKSSFAFPEIPFQTFTDLEELVGRLADPDFGRISDAMQEDVWASGWPESLSRFLAREGRLENEMD